MRAVVVHRGARDGYQAAWALAERGLLERLVTDLYWPADRSFGKACARSVAALRARYGSGVPSSLTDCCWLSGFVSFALDHMPHVPFVWRQQATRWADRSLGRTAGKLAARSGTALLSYSYYGSSAFAAAAPNTPRILFQLHPHPLSVRRILRRELQDHPECSTSLLKEWELALPEREFDVLAQEAALAQHWIAASTFTRQTLIENGIDSHRIHVVPYGVDCERFRPAPALRGETSAPLRLLFVGTINQRKGIKYLLEALSLVPDMPLEMTICGRPVDDLALLRGAGNRITVKPSLSSGDLLAEYQRADLFVFPSVAEGFGQVLLEAMACGLPVLSTTHTAAPDLVREGIDGFVVPPRRPDLLALRIEWAGQNRGALAQMGLQARFRAEGFSQERFRAGLASVFEQCSATTLQVEVPAYV